MADVVFLNGTVGVGKSTVADGLGRLERGLGRAHAVIDLDWLRAMWPSPDDDPFHAELELANLRSVASHYRAAGARHVILAGVIEHGDALPRYRDALAGAELTVCRLTVDAAVGRARLRTRHRNDPSGLAWHLDRASELAAILERAALDDFVVDTTDRSPAEVAAQVHRAAGWS